jgi:hypothetical protein
MSRAAAAAAYLLIFVLASGLLFPGLLPDQQGLPSGERGDGPTRIARENWLEALAFEEVLNAAMNRFGEPQLQSTYMGGGIYIIGDLRDGTLSPLTWITWSLSPIGRVKAKMLMAILAAYLATIAVARRRFEVSRAVAACAGFAFLLLIRLWPSLRAFPLDAGLLFVPCGFAMLWTIRGRILRTGLAGIFFALACWQTGAGMIAALIAIVLIGFAWRLSPDDKDRATLTDTWLAISLGLAFGAIRFLPMSEGVASLSDFRAFTALRFGQYEVPIQIAGALPMGAKVGIVLVIAALWFLRGRVGFSGAVVTASFGALAILPEWTTISGKVYGPSGYPGPIDSPSRYFFPFFAFFAALTIGAAASRMNKPRVWISAILVVALLTSTVFLAKAAREPNWAPPEDKLDLGSFQIGENDFFQVQSPKHIRRASRQESWHPAVLASKNIGVVDPLFLHHRKSPAGARFLVYGNPPKIRPTRAYRTEFYSGGKRIELLNATEQANRIVLSVDGKRPGRVVINRNFHRGWQAQGAEAVSFRRLLAVNVQASGKQVVELVFRPFTLTLGIRVTAIALAFFALFSIWEAFALRRRA